MSKKNNPKKTTTSKSIIGNNIKSYIVLVTLISTPLIIFTISAVIKGQISISAINKSFTFDNLELYLLLLSLITLIVTFYLPVLEYFERKKKIYNRESIIKKHVNYRKISVSLAFLFLISSVVVMSLN